MAETPKGRKPKKTLDAFADDLDAMLNAESGSKTAHPGMIEDDAAIDRLLMNDRFPTGDDGDGNEAMDRSFLEEDSGKQEHADIDDLLADFQINSNRLKEPIFDEFDDVIGEDEEKHRVRDADVDLHPELSALTRVEDLDEFADDPIDSPAPASAPAAGDLAGEVVDTMEEIDEFSADFRLADSESEFSQSDFDISSGEELPAKPTPASEVDEADIDALLASAAVEPAGIASAPSAGIAAGAENQAPANAALAADARPAPLSNPEPFAASPEYAQLRADVNAHAVQMAELDRHITVLKKQLQVVRQEMTEKAAKSDLAAGLDAIDSLQTEQKKAKRAVEALDKKKPVAAYVASGLAVAALFIGTGLGFQGFIAKSQVGELTQMLIKTQEQIKSAPASQAADAELTRKKLDELTVADSVAASQIAELKKSLQSGAAASAGAGAAGGDAAKQLAELTAQNMQMGAAIEAMENTIKTLQKNRPSTPAAAAPKPEKKPPPVVVENWAVNLIAFKQDWYAKRKAEEFAAKGVPAKVSQSESKGETWYRISVDGFKSQYEAASYAAKVKKTLNLDSVWVARIKD